MDWKAGHLLVKLLLNRTVVSCPNKLKYADKVNVCEAVFPIAQMLEHLDSQCPFRVVACRGKSCQFSDFMHRMFFHESKCEKAIEAFMHSGDSQNQSKNARLLN